LPAVSTTTLLPTTQSSLTTIAKASTTLMPTIATETATGI